MKPEEQIKAIAELDGCPEKYWWCPKCNEFVRPDDVTYSECHDVRSDGCGEGVEGVDQFKPYLTSRDAIVPVIVKWCDTDRKEHKYEFELGETYYRLANQEHRCFSMKSFDYITATPAQLCEALLRASGKWRDE